MSADAQVLKLLQGQNKPFGLQNLVDLLAHAGIKKAGIQKALDALVEAGQVIAKEFGKTKIFIPAQSDLSVLSKEEMDAKRTHIRELGEEVQREQASLKECEQDLNAWKSSLTDSQLVLAIQQCKEQLIEKQSRLERLRSGAVLVSKEHREEAVKNLQTAVEGWKKRKGMFRSIWSTISDGLDGPQDDYFEEMGVESDEAVGADLKLVEKLLPGTASLGANKRLRVAMGLSN